MAAFSTLFIEVSTADVALVRVCMKTLIVACQGYTFPPCFTTFTEDVPMH